MKKKCKLPKRQQGGTTSREAALAIRNNPTNRNNPYITVDAPTRRAPIYTSNPNDPRLQAYQDSLALFNLGQEGRTFFLNNVEPLIMVNDHSGATRLWHGTNPDSFFSRTEPGVMPAWNRLTTLNRVVPTGQRHSSRYDPMYGYTTFKKPVQPVYKKEQLIDNIQQKSGELPSQGLGDINPLSFKSGSYFTRPRQRQEEGNGSLTDYFDKKTGKLLGTYKNGGKVNTTWEILEDDLPEAENGDKAGYSWSAQQAPNYGVVGSVEHQNQRKISPRTRDMGDPLYKSPEPEPIATGRADYLPLESLLLPSTPAIKSFGKLGNAALDALNPVSGMGKYGPNKTLIRTSSGKLKWADNKVTNLEDPVQLEDFYKRNPDMRPEFPIEDVKTSNVTPHKFDNKDWYKDKDFIDPEKLIHRNKQGEIIYQIDPADYNNFSSKELYEQALKDKSNYLSNNPIRVNPEDRAISELTTKASFGERPLLGEVNLWDTYDWNKFEDYGIKPKDTDFFEIPKEDLKWRTRMPTPMHQEGLPADIQYMRDLQNKNNWFNKASDRDFVKEMRRTYGYKLELDDIKNMSEADLGKVAKDIRDKMLQAGKARQKGFFNNPKYTGGKAAQSLTPNKLGGKVSAKTKHANNWQILD